MQYLIWDDMTCCTEEDVRRLMPIVSEERRAYALRYRHLFGRWATLKTYEMLLHLGFPPEKWLFTPDGKPYIAGGPHFSISHCQTALAVAIDNRPVGIDVESIRKWNPSLAERTMNAAELALIARDPDPARAFIRLWTRKEAFLKWKGTGIREELSDTLRDTRGCTITTLDAQDYVLSIAQQVQRPTTNDKRLNI